MESIEKSFMIEGTDLTRVDGESCIPTGLYYDDKGAHIGQRALQMMGDNKIVNLNFKVQLGEYVLGATRDKIDYFECADGTARSAYQLTKDFFDGILSNIEEQGIIPKGDKNGLKILVAEPLSFQIEEKGHIWIKNYRDNIKRIL
ncbi:MAG TPA: hypothetical protein PK036_15625, partial [Geobacteraceae bacterium]|nr:hypothetical protein [Geobacteraceae bacterium]